MRAAGWLLASAALLAPNAAMAQDSTTLETVVVTATRTPLSTQKIGSAITVLDAEFIDREQLTTVDEALERVPGVNMTRSGGIGQNTQVRMRGFTTKHVLTMIDGIKLNNPSESDNQYGLEHIFLDSVERIEILRGPQSGLYGGDAVAGVINIITRRGSGEPRLRVSGLYGTENTMQVLLGSEGEIGKVGYTASASYFQTDGISLASRPPGNVERDGYSNLTLSLRGDWAVTDDINIDGWVRYIKSKNDIDANYLPADNPLGLPAYLFQDSSGWSKNDQVMAALHGTWTMLGGHLTHNAQISYVDMTGTYTSPGVEQDSEGLTIEASYYANYTFTPGTFILAGVERKVETGVFEQPVGAGYATVDETIANTGWFATAGVEPVAGMTLSGAVRYDDNEVFGGDTTYRLTGAYNLPDGFDIPGVKTKLRASYGTGGEAPGLRQLLGSSATYQGNPDLHPESTEMLDFGIDQSLESGFARWSLTYYDGTALDGIFNITDPNTGISSPQNITSPVDMKGVEAELYVFPAEWIDFSLSFTNATCIQRSNGQQLFARPLNQISGAVTLRPMEKLSLTLDMYARSKFFSDYPTTWQMPGYGLFNLAASYQINDSLRLIAKVQNLLDKDYEEKLGDSTYGRTAQVRLTYTF
ncbi:MAG TPA: TonB-dependent receptor [Rhizomicrobium sp.]